MRQIRGDIGLNRLRSPSSMGLYSLHGKMVVKGEGGPRSSKTMKSMGGRIHLNRIEEFSKESPNITLRK